MGYWIEIFLLEVCTLKTGHDFVIVALGLFPALFTLSLSKTSGILELNNGQRQSPRSCLLFISKSEQIINLIKMYNEAWRDVIMGLPSGCYQCYCETY